MKAVDIHASSVGLVKFVLFSRTELCSVNLISHAINFRGICGQLKNTKFNRHAQKCFKTHKDYSHK